MCFIISNDVSQEKSVCRLHLEPRGGYYFQVFSKIIRGVARYEIVVGHTLNPFSKSVGVLCY